MNNQVKEGYISEILGGYGDIIVDNRLLLKDNEDAIEIRTIPDILGRDKHIAAFRANRMHEYKVGDKITYIDQDSTVGDIMVVGKVNFNIIQRLFRFLRRRY